MRTNYTCPLELTNDMLSVKWKTIILWCLRLGETSLSKLEKDISGITPKMLLEQLKELCLYEFVEKKLCWLSSLNPTWYQNARNFKNYATFRNRISIQNAPKETKIFALILEDKDAYPAVGVSWIYWLACDVITTEVDKNASILTNDVVQGCNGWVSVLGISQTRTF